MKHEQQHGPLEPQDVEELLPWYVTGRVSREEARGIEAALKTMPDLADKLAQVQRERDAVARASETVEPAPPETLQRLLQQVETTRQWRVPKIESHSEAGGWLRAAMGRNAVWQTALAVACVAIVACLIMSIWSRNPWYLQWLCFLLGACICVLVLAYFRNGTITLGLVILRRHAFVGLALASFGTLAGVAYFRRRRS